MKILILTLYFPPEIGAAPTRLHAIALELAKLGHSVEVVTGMPNYPQGRIFPAYRTRLYLREVWDGIVIHRVWLYSSVGQGISRLLNYLSFSLFSLYGLFRSQKPDYLFVESPPLTLTGPGRIYAFLRGVPLILNVADLWPDTLVEMGLLKPGFTLDLLYKLERWAYQQATYVNAVTEGLRNSLLKEKAVPLEKVFFLPNGVDTQLHQPSHPDEQLIQALGLKEKKVILYSGTLGRAHGLKNVLEAAKILEAEQDIHFMFLGDGSERPALEEMTKRLRLHNVSFHEAVPAEKLAPYHSIAHCGLVSLRNLSIFEGARPSKMFPLMAAGKPLIFCGNGEGAELVRQAKAGIVVRPGDAQALASAIPKLLRNAGLLEELGANSRQFVEEHYEWPRLVGKWVGELAAATGSTKKSNLIIQQPHQDRKSTRLNSSHRL